MFVGRNKASGFVYYFPLSVPECCESLMYFFCHLFSHSHFCFASISPPSPPSLHALSLASTLLSRVSPPHPPPNPPPLWCRGGSERVEVVGVLWWAGEAGVWASSGGGRGPLVCLGAPNESVIHGTRGSHRDRIRGALSNRSPERVKRYLICPPCSQLPLCAVCVLVGVCVFL